MTDFLFDESELLGTLRELVSCASKTPEDDMPEELENRICALWDATSDQACCQFLANNHLVVCLEGSIQRVASLRTKELCWGILSNVASHGIGGFTDDFPYVSLILDSSDGAVIGQCLRFALATICSKLIPSSYWVPLSDMCLWCVENCMIASVVQTAADMLSAIYQRKPSFHLVRPCAERAQDLAQNNDEEEDLAAQACMRTVETGIFAENVSKEEVTPLLGTILGSLRGSSKMQVATIEVMEIIADIIPANEWPLESWHRDQIAANDDLTAEQKTMFGVDPDESAW